MFGHRSDKFECQGQRSRSPGTKTAFFGHFGGLRVVHSGKISLALVFLFVHKISLEPLSGFGQIHRQDVFGPSLGRV